MRPYRIPALMIVLALTMGAANWDADRDRVVAFDVSVTDKHGSPVRSLEKENFRLYEDGVEQALIRVSPVERAVALVVLVEVSDAMAYHMPASMDPAVNLLESLRPSDWGAVVTFASKADIVRDFTRDKNALLTSLRRRPAHYGSEVALYDALYFVLDRMRGLDEKTALLLIASGNDTMSRRTYGQAMRKAETSGATIYTVGLPQPYVERWRPFPHSGPEVNGAGTEYMLRSFAEATGGISFVPQISSQFSVIHTAIDTDVRNQYTLTFSPTHSDESTRLRKLKVEVVNTDIDHNGKRDKLIVRHRKGY